MDARLRFAVHRDIGGCHDVLLPDLAAVRAECAFDGIHPVLHLAIAIGRYRARLRFEKDVTVALHICALRDGEARLTVRFRIGIFLDGNRDRCRIQDVAVRADADRASLARAVTARRERNVSLRRFCGRPERGIRPARVGDIILRAGVARQTEDVDQCRAVDIRIISCTDSDRTTLVRAVIRIAFCFSLPVLSGRIRLLCLAGFEAGTVRDSRARRRFDIERLIHVRRTDGGTGRQSIVVMRFDAACRVDGDGFLVMQGLARGLLICREVRRTRLHGDFPEIGFRGVGDFRHAHDTIPARVGRAAGDCVLFLRLRAVLPCLFADVIRADGRLAPGRHTRAVTDGDFRRGVDGVPRVRAGAAVAARTDGLDLIVSSVFMIRGNLRAARLDLDVLPDRGFCLMVHLDTDDSDRSIDDAAASGDGMRIGIVVICRLVHRRAGDELVRRRERCPASDGDTRGVFGLDLCYGHPHAADADARRGRERGYLRCVFRRKGNGFPRELRVLPDLRCDIHRRRKVCARSRAAEDACRCAECLRIHRCLRIRRHRERVICLHFALVLALIVSDARLRRAGDIRCDDSTIQCRVERHRGPGHIRRQRAVIV